MRTIHSSCGSATVGHCSGMSVILIDVADETHYQKLKGWGFRPILALDSVPHSFVACVLE